MRLVRRRLGQDAINITHQGRQHARRCSQFKATIGPTIGKYDVIHKTGST